MLSREGRLVVLLVDRAVKVPLADQRLDGMPDLRLGDAVLHTVTVLGVW